MIERRAQNSQVFHDLSKDPLLASFLPRDCRKDCEETLTFQHYMSNTLSQLKDVRLIELKPIRESNGTLVPITARKEIPIRLERIFYVSGVEPGVTRGEHAHIECSQVLICPQGACQVMCDDGKEQKTFTLSSGSVALYVPPGIWMTQTYLTPGSFLMVLTDAPYSEADYLRDYDAFLRHRNGGVKKAA